MIENTGYCELEQMEIPETLQRPRGQQQYEEQPERQPLQNPAVQLAPQPPDDDHDDDDVNNQ